MDIKHEPKKAFRILSGILLLGLLISSGGTAPAAAEGTGVAGWPQASARCDPQTYYGVQHCSDGTGMQYILVDLNDSHVRFQTVLPEGTNGECNSVNPVELDPGSNCSRPYPFEKMTKMLERYQSRGAVAVINTDYFGKQDKSHGAQGLAVQNGVRLDGPGHAVGNDYAYTTPSLAISPSNDVTIGIPGSQAAIDSNLAGRYYNTVGGAPLIVSGGQPVNLKCTYPYPGETCSKPAQSAAGVTADGRLILITAQQSAADISVYLIKNFNVQTAIKFDGGGSARQAWLEADGSIGQWGATDEDRAVAEGLLVFSSRIEPSSGPLPLPNSGIWETIQKAWSDFWAGIQQSINNWIAEQQKNLDQQVQSWWQDLQKQLINWLEQTITGWLNQACGTAYLAPAVLAVAWFSHHRRKRP